MHFLNHETANLQSILALKKKPDPNIFKYFPKKSITSSIKDEIKSQNQKPSGPSYKLAKYNKENYNLKMNLTESTATQSQKTRTIDVAVETLFSKYDRGHEGHLTRLQIAQILTEIFTQFGLSNPVTRQDVDNFLLDYDITHKGDLTRKDFEGISKLRFILREIPLSNTPSALKVVLPQQQPELKQIIVPVRMLFDIFNKRHDGHLTREEIKDVIKLIFKDFNMPYDVNDMDVQNFLQDFDINHDHEITMEDFKGVDVLHFDLHSQNEMRVY